MDAGLDNVIKEQRKNTEEAIKILKGILPAYKNAFSTITTTLPKEEISSLTQDEIETLEEAYDNMVHGVNINWCVTPMEKEFSQDELLQELIVNKAFSISKAFVGIVLCDVYTLRYKESGDIKDYEKAKKYALFKDDVFL